MLRRLKLNIKTGVLQMMIQLARDASNRTTTISRYYLPQELHWDKTYAHLFTHTFIHRNGVEIKKKKESRYYSQTHSLALTSQHISIRREKSGIQKTTERIEKKIIKRGRNKMK